MKKVSVSIVAMMTLALVACGGESPEEADKVCTCYTELNATAADMEPGDLENKLQACEKMSIELQEKDMKAFEHMRDNCAALKN
jgi:hypothetical protein